MGGVGAGAGREKAEGLKGCKAERAVNSASAAVAVAGRAGSEMDFFIGEREEERGR